MIAAGLCMMGGCFAQNGTTATVDTYWPAERILINSGIQNAVIAESIIHGGDSEHDFLQVVYQTDVYYISHLISGLKTNEIKPGQVTFSGTAGWNGTEGGDSTGLEVCVLSQNGVNSTWWIEPLGVKNTWWMKAGSYKRGDDTAKLTTYSLDDTTPRFFRIGSALLEQNRYYYNITYANSRTGVKAQWQPMVSNTGTALFEVSTATLAEQ